MKVPEVLECYVILYGERENVWTDFKAFLGPVAELELCEGAKLFVKAKGG